MPRIGKRNRARFAWPGYYETQCHANVPHLVRDLAAVLRRAGVDALAVGNCPRAKRHLTTRPDKNGIVHALLGSKFSTLYIVAEQTWTYRFIEALVRTQARRGGSPGQVSARQWRRIKAQFVEHMRTDSALKLATHSAWISGGEAAVFKLFGLPLNEDEVEDSPY